MLAVGNEGLGKRVTKGQTVTNGTLSGVIEYGKDAVTGEERETLGYISIEGQGGYVVSVAGKLLKGWSIV